ncbi:MAG TPA: SH3 domain-containing protein [Steroidobacteraceae bacterium]|nr:SH3 domain-containing protein [Steroidobacteraceae bacterium]
MHRALSVVAIVAMTACGGVHKAEQPAPAPPAEQPVTTPTPEPQPTVTRDPQLEQQLAHSELRLLEKEAQIEDLQAQLDDARQEVVRAMAKLQSLATRAEAASGIAEAEIALQSLRATGSAPAIGELTELMRQSTAEFDKQNYGGALYLANQVKTAAATARGQLASVDRGSLRPGEVPFALPLELRTTTRANVRDGPGGDFKVLFTLPAGVPVTGQSYADQWVRITDDGGRRGWVYRSLIGRRP